MRRMPFFSSRVRVGEWRPRGVEAWGKEVRAARE